jgi:hypothetical protein
MSSNEIARQRFVEFLAVRFKLRDPEQNRVPTACCTDPKLPDNNRAVATMTAATVPTTAMVLNSPLLPENPQ